MKVVHTFPENGKSKILLEDSRYPNGPVSNSEEHMVEFLEYNVEQMRLAAKEMEANEDRQNLILEMTKQQVMLNKLKGRIKDRMLAEKHRIGVTEKR